MEAIVAAIVAIITAIIKLYINAKNKDKNDADARIQAERAAVESRNPDDIHAALSDQHDRVQQALCDGIGDRTSPSDKR